MDYELSQLEKNCTKGTTPDILRSNNFFQDVQKWRKGQGVTDAYKRIVECSYSIYKSDK